MNIQIIMIQIIILWLMEMFNKYKSLKDNNIHNSDIIILQKNISLYGSMNSI